MPQTLQPNSVRREPASVGPMHGGPTIDTVTFVDRRGHRSDRSPEGRERRQFGNSYDGLSSEGRELGLAIDEYKLRFRRRFVTYDEIVDIVKSLGYRKD